MRTRLMRTIALVVLTAIASGFPHQSLAVAQSQEEQPRSVWDGVYSDEQAKRGEALYRKNCVACHGSLLTGGEMASPLSGAIFFSNWNGLDLDVLFERIRKSMPQDRPGKLSRQVNADILAYLLSFNKFPAGKSDLPSQNEFLRQIRFETLRPGGKK
jgi:cytochrome c